MNNTNIFLLGVNLGVIIGFICVANMDEIINVKGQKGEVLTVEYKDVVYRLVPLEKDE